MMANLSVKLSLTTRIFLGFAVVLVTFGGVSLFSVSELHRSQLEIRLVSEGYLSLSQTVAALETFLTYQSKDMERLRDEENTEARRAEIRLQRPYFPSLITERLEAGRATARRVRELAPESEQRFVEEVTRKLDELSGRLGEYEAGVGELFTLLESDAPDLARAGEELKRLQLLERASSSSIRLLHGSIEARIHERVRRAEERGRRTEVAIILLPVVAIAVGLLATGIAARSLRPVRMLSEGLGRIRQGDFDTRLGIPGDDEIAQLAAQFDAMVGALRDRDALLRQKQAELLRAERLAAVGRVSAQVAHEVRNPLSSIGLNVELLEDRLGQATFSSPEAGTETRELLAAVTREIDRVTEITEDYLRLARLPPPVLREENLVELLEDVLGFSSGELTRSGVTLATTFPPGPLPVRVDEAQLRQVFLNLIRNAREAMPGGGTLTVTAWSTPAGVEIRVQDTGEGMSPEVQERIYEPFFTTKTGGTGLGLALSRQIVEAHGGRLEVESAVGKGTTFHVFFPP
jgi:two-component system, NtrC family, sensor kinase